VVVAERYAAYKGRTSMSEPAGPIPTPPKAPASPAAPSAPTAPTSPRAPAPPTAATATTEARPSTGTARAAEPAKPKRFRATRPRQARVVIRKVGPWTVLKLSFLFYLCVMVVIMGALVILYGVLEAIGALESVTELIRDLFADQTFEIHGDWLFSRGLVIGFAMVVLWSLINLFVAFLYNLLADIVGGVEVTLSERR
jgi:hypothetical protein